MMAKRKLERKALVTDLLAQDWNVFGSLFATDPRSSVKRGNMVGKVTFS